MRVWLTVAVLAFNLYAFFDCARTNQEAIRKGPKWAWLLSIFLFEIFAATSWFIWGRPKKPGNGRGKRKIIPPDDDPDFLRKI